MNPRIRELAEQAGMEFDDDWVLESEPIYYIKHSDLEKFAELIVRECIQKITLAEKSKDNVVLWQDKDRNHITWLLRQHFGVEE